MSCIINGELKMPSRLNKSFGGTENMARNFMKYVPIDSYDEFQIHISKLTHPIIDGKKQLLWVHDNHCDQDSPASLYAWNHFIFVSDWQRRQFMREHNLNFEKTSVIENIIEFIPNLSVQKPKDKINFVYSGVPDRGLDVLYDVFDLLCQKYDNLHLTVFSSYKLYAWSDIDHLHQALYEKIRTHKNITYHDFVPDYNEVIKAKYNSHFFLYPCTWLENSSISLIESLACGCVCIHTDFSAMPETAAGRSILYDMPFDRQSHIQKCFDVTSELIDKYIETNELPNNYERLLYKHTPQHFTEKWLELFKQLEK